MNDILAEQYTLCSYSGEDVGWMVSSMRFLNQENSSN
jgi:hypothetical protein